MTDVSAEAVDGDRRPQTGLRAALGGTVGLALWSLLLVGLLVASATYALRLRSQDAESQARAAAVQAARQEALNLTSVDGTDIEQDLERVLEGASGTFRQEFEAQSQRLSAVLQENQVRASGEVLDAGLARFDGDTATVLVVIDSVVANKDIPDGQTRTYRMQLELERVGDRWLTSTLEFVS